VVHWETPREANPRPFYRTRRPSEYWTKVDWTNVVLLLHHKFRRRFCGNRRTQIGKLGCGRAFRFALGLSRSSRVARSKSDMRDIHDSVFGLSG